MENDGKLMENSWKLMNLRIGRRKTHKHMNYSQNSSAVSVFETWEIGYMRIYKLRNNGDYQPQYEYNVAILTIG